MKKTIQIFDVRLFQSVRKNVLGNVIHTGNLDLFRIKNLKYLGV